MADRTDDELAGALVTLADEIDLAQDHYDHSDVIMEAALSMADMSVPDLIELLREAGARLTTPCTMAEVAKGMRAALDKGRAPEVTPGTPS